MEIQHPIQEDEIDLREYIKVIIKRKKLILGIFIFAILASVIYSLLLPKIYETTSIIQLGSISEPLINKEEAQQIILNHSNLQSAIKELGLDIQSESLKKSIKFNVIQGTNLLSIKITSSNIDAALRLHDVIIKPLIAQGQEMYLKRVSLINARLKELNGEISSLEEDISRVQSLITGMPKINNISQQDISVRIILLQNSLSNYESNLNALRNQRGELELSLANAREFKVFSQPFRPENPIAPKKTQIIILAGLAGLMLGVFLAFLKEFWQGVKK
ncbi:MAG: LPS O-antigen length regulator [Candidatus Omnitrophica bacterium ADurb.Bin205]|nr:MAG: LPS O-antigen length regulator [Candidatus Omnitrophica bacterium ADurb.Bin205]